MDLELNKKQKDIKELIYDISYAVNKYINSQELSYDFDAFWAEAVGMRESSLGVNQKSGTGARGVFQMTSIAMKDLLLEMEKKDDDVSDVLCGIAFLWILLKRWKTIENATLHFCDPKDRDFYFKDVEKFMNIFKGV